MSYLNNFKVQMLHSPQKPVKYVMGDLEEAEIIKWLGGGFGNDARRIRSDLLCKTMRVASYKNMRGNEYFPRHQLFRLNMSNVLNHMTLNESLSCAYILLDADIWAKNEIMNAFEIIIGSRGGVVSDEDAQIIRSSKFFRIALSSLLISGQFKSCDLAFEKLRCEPQDVLIDTYPLRIIDHNGIGMNAPIALGWGLDEIKPALLPRLTDLVVLNYHQRVFGYLKEKSTPLMNVQEARDFVANICEIIKKQTIDAWQRASANQWSQGGYTIADFSNRIIESLGASLEMYCDALVRDEVVKSYDEGIATQQAPIRRVKNKM